MATRSATLPANLGRPSITFRFAIGVYVAAVVGIGGLLAGTLVGAAGPTLVLIALSLATVGLIAGGAWAGRVPGLPERIGRSRRLMAVCFLPTGIFTTLGVLGVALPSLSPGPFLAVALIGVALLGVLGLLVVRLARDRYVTAITPDEPAASWIWANPWRQRRWLAIGGLATGLGLWILAAGDIGGALWPLAVGVFALVFSRYSPFDIYTDPEAHRSKLHVHDAGLVKELRYGVLSPVAVGATNQQYGTGLVPWAQISGVRLTADELVLERARRTDIRCRRSTIDDPEAVLEAIERARRGDGVDVRSNSAVGVAGGESASGTRE